MGCTPKKFGPIGLVVLTFIGHKQTNKQTSKVYKDVDTFYLYSCTCNAMSIEFTCVHTLIHLFAFPWLSSSVLGIHVSRASWVAVS